MPTPQVLGASAAEVISILGGSLAPETNRLGVGVAIGIGIEEYTDGLRDAQLPWTARTRHTWFKSSDADGPIPIPIATPTPNGKDGFGGARGGT